MANSTSYGSWGCGVGAASLRSAARQELAGKFCFDPTFVPQLQSTLKDWSKFPDFLGLQKNFTLPLSSPGTSMLPSSTTETAPGANELASSKDPLSSSPDPSSNMQLAVMAKDPAAPPTSSLCYPAAPKPGTQQQSAGAPMATTTLKAGGASATVNNAITVTVSSGPDKGGAFDSDDSKWAFVDNNGYTVLFHTRSLYGAYQYLGEILRANELKPSVLAGKEFDNTILSPPAKADVDGQSRYLLYLTHTAADCFTNLEYEGKQWCVPNDAYQTKRVFSMLHQLFELYAAPSNQQTTPTVRVTQ